MSGECAVPELNATFCFLWFTNCVLHFDKSRILGCLWPLVFVLSNTLILGIWCSTIPHLPGCFCPWTFFENIGFNTVLTDPFMSHLATQLGYSAGEFQALHYCPCGFWCRGLKEKETQHSFADYWIYTAVVYGCDTCKLYSSIGQNRIGA